MRAVVRSMTLLVCGTGALLWASRAHAFDAGCQLRYPVVLSHHWAMARICPSSAPASGPASCVQAQDYDRYCADKGSDAQGNKTCGRWQVTPEEENLPPRNVNAYEPALTRDVRQYHRYFSLAIVNRLRQVCGNQVYLADKPVYASYEVRARSLRNTVKQALRETRADKVIVIGFSQGVQDARYMAAMLPVSDDDAAQGAMRSKVAAIVSLAGEDGGAESAQISLELGRTLTLGQWQGAAAALGFVDAESQVVNWQRQTAGQTDSVLVEQCQGDVQCRMGTADRDRWIIRSLYELSPRYMRPPLLQLGLSSPTAWNELRQFVQAGDMSWADRLPASAERGNGIRYLSYASQIRNWYPGWGDLLSRDQLFFSLISVSDGPNDVFVSVGRQKFSNWGSNFEHVRTLAGQPSGRGYHHMFFSGRNDGLYVPAAGTREAAPYDGNSADFFQQVARDLKARGL